MGRITPDEKYSVEKKIPLEDGHPLSGDQRNNWDEAGGDLDPALVCTTYVHLVLELENGAERTVASTTLDILPQVLEMSLGKLQPRPRGRRRGQERGPVQTLEGRRETEKKKMSKAEGTFKNKKQR